MSDTEIINKLHLNQLSEAAKQQMLATINGEIELRLAGIIDDTLNEEQRSQFNQLSESGSPEDVMKWLSVELTDLNELYEQALEDYIDEINSKTDLITKQ